MAKVSELWCFTQKGVPGTSLTKAAFVKNSGMEGNRYQGGLRQVSIMRLETKQWMEQQTQKGLCFRRYKANIVVENLAPASLAVGQALSVGTAGFAITEYNKTCFDNCPLFQSGQACALPFSTAFATVVESGEVSLGDNVLVYEN